MSCPSIGLQAQSSAASVASRPSNTSAQTTGSCATHASPPTAQIAIAASSNLPLPARATIRGASGYGRAARMAT